MKTIVTDSTEEAARFIREGGTVAFPTETVYGLGADVFNEFAISKIFSAKQRPADNPLIAHVGDVSQIELLARDVPDPARAFIERFFPGPLTLVVPKADKVPSIATAGLDTIGVRMPSGKVTHEFLKACGTPVVAPSANVSGRPSPTDWESVLEDLEGKIDCILKGEPSRVGLESTVVDCTEDVPVVLRPGAVSIEQLRKVVPETVAITETDGAAMRSPGMRHKHYSPKAKVILVDPTDVRRASACRGSCAFIGLSAPPDNSSLTMIVDSTEEYARELFGFFRLCDRKGIGTILCETVPEEGIGTALMDRLRRAADSMLGP
ncbi:MAG: threonylcarbamoyl-AMP synthase [Acidobacteriota bacterium]|nr:MAG: threonylcarbamoyl-AMP synthase [Acidobacteriota bacterium]